MRLEQWGFRSCGDARLQGPLRQCSLQRRCASASEAFLHCTLHAWQAGALLSQERLFKPHAGCAVSIAEGGVSSSRGTGVPTRHLVISQELGDLARWPAPRGADPTSCAEHCGWLFCCFVFVISSSEWNFRILTHLLTYLPSFLFNDFFERQS